MIGPDIPAHLLQNRSTTPDDGPEEAGPSQPPPAIGPVIPPELHSRDRTPQANNEEDEDEDDYVPELPPDLAAARAKPNAGAKRVQGPSFPGAPPRRQYDDDSDDDVGPMPLPAGYVLEEKDGVTEFLEREERRRKQLEEASKPKTLQREEWMLKPPSSSDLLSCTFSPRYAPPRPSLILYPQRSTPQSSRRDANSLARRRRLETWTTRSGRRLLPNVRRVLRTRCPGSVGAQRTRTRSSRRRSSSKLGNGPGMKRRFGRVSTTTRGELVARPCSTSILTGPQRPRRRKTETSRRHSGTGTGTWPSVADSWTTRRETSSSTTPVDYQTGLGQGRVAVSCDCWTGAGVFLLNVHSAVLGQLHVYCLS